MKDDVWAFSSGALSKNSKQQNRYSVHNLGITLEKLKKKLFNTSCEPEVINSLKLDKNTFLHLADSVYQPHIV